ncbi:hypothetical protein I3843_15G100000 [Carya illinoinensis]|nr:hypothetical protein I3843_15G100000 [Carya illinoinensis]
MFVLFPMFGILCGYRFIEVAEPMLYTSTKVENIKEEKWIELFWDFQYSWNPIRSLTQNERGILKLGASTSRSGGEGL